MNPLSLVVPMIVALPLLVFWGWMFRDMTHNPYLPDSARYYWTVAFVFMNVLAAAWYYGAEYRSRH